MLDSLKHVKLKTQLERRNYRVFVCINNVRRGNQMRGGRGFEPGIRQSDDWWGTVTFAWNIQVLQSIRDLYWRMTIVCIQEMNGCDTPPPRPPKDTSVLLRECVLGKMRVWIKATDWVFATFTWFNVLDHHNLYSLNVKRVKWLLFKRVKTVKTTLIEWKSPSKRVKIIPKRVKIAPKRVKITPKEWIARFWGAHRGTARNKRAVPQ